MRVLLRNTRTGLFYAGPDIWAKDNTEALDFEQTRVALDRVETSKLRDMEVLMHFDDTALDIPLAIVGS